jgi:hypothetical protein
VQFKVPKSSPPSLAFQASPPFLGICTFQTFAPYTPLFCHFSPSPQSIDLDCVGSSPAFGDPIPPLNP